MNYHNITHDDMNNGEGLRVVGWFSGCSHHCYNCQNPQTWDAKSGIPFNASAKQEIFTELSKDYISGLTLSGGDPLYKDNVDEIYNLVSEVKDRFPRKTIWLYSGYTWEQIWEDGNFNIEEYPYSIVRRDIICLSDVFIDGEFQEALKDVTLKWRGSKNQRVIDIQKSLLKDKIVLYCD